MKHVSPLQVLNVSFKNPLCTLTGLLDCRPLKYLLWDRDGIILSRIQMQKSNQSGSDFSTNNVTVNVKFSLGICIHLVIIFKEYIFDKRPLLIFFWLVSATKSQNVLQQKSPAVLWKGEVKITNFLNK